MKALKVIFVLIFSFATLNLYSVNTCKTIEKHKVENKVDNTIEKSNHPVKDYSDNMSPKTKKILRTVGLVLLTLIITAFSIISPIAIIAAGFMAPHPLLWLLLLGVSCLISIFGAGLIVYYNHKKDNMLFLTILNGIPILAGVISSIVWGFLTLITLLWWGQY